MSGSLDVRDLIVRYGAVTALHGASLQAVPGRVTAVVGPNGAGKSTLLRTVSGLVRPAGGSVEFDGRSIAGLKPFRIARAGLALVPEGRGVVAPLSVEENLLLGAGQVSGGEARSRMAEQLELFPSLSRRRGTSAGLLSGGEQQMLAIARGLMSRPKLLAIDEPSMGLAPVVVRDVVTALNTTRTSGVGILLVEQNVALARELADHIYVLSNGRIIAEGAPGELPTDLMSAYMSA